MGKLAGVSPRRIVFSLSAAISVAVVLAAFYLLSDGEIMATNVDRRRVAETPVTSSVSSVLQQDSRTANSEISTLSTVHWSPQYVVANEPTIAEVEDEDIVSEQDIVSPVGAVDEDKQTTPELVVNTTLRAPASFSIRTGFNFPHPQVFLPTQKILSSKWVDQLKDYLRSIHPARSLTITVATQSFIPNLLNWLIAVHTLIQPPLEQVLVLGFDKGVHTLLSARNISCVYVPYSSVLKGHHKGVSTVWMTRLAVMRLLNHWGYDVLQLDNDAVPLKNPHLLFDGYSDYDLVGARGVLPFELGRGKWGFTLCMGAALLRGTEKMETLWKVMHGNKVDKTADDQKRVNFALLKSNLQWQTKEQQFDRASVGTNKDGVRVAVLPRRYICRKTCSLEDGSETIIWHQAGGGHSASWKSKHGLKLTVWFLRYDYDTRPVDPSVTGMQWLKQLTLPGSIDNVREKLTPAHAIAPEIL